MDAGLAREPRVDHARGLSSLTTVRASRAAARQRAGRAGREAPGVVYRCWAEAEDARMPRFPAPEIKVADLTAFALQAACWGDPDASGLALLDPPPGGAMTAARSVLEAVGAVDSPGRATERGARLARLGLHPRLGRALLDAAELSTEMSPRAASATAATRGPHRRTAPGHGCRPWGRPRRAGHGPADPARAGFPADVAGSGGGEVVAEVVGLLSEEPPREYGDDLVSVLRAARRGGDAYGARWRAEVRRLRAAVQDGDGGDGQRAGDEVLAGLVAALAFPERVARKDGGSYLMVSGTRAELPEASALRGAPWIAVAVADRPVGRGHARVQLAAAVDEETARLAAGALLTERDEVHWADGDVVARRVERLGAVELAVRPLTGADPALVRGALLEGLRREGLGLLRRSADADLLRKRLAFLRRHIGEPWPDVTDDTLLARADEWLEPELSRARRRADLGRIDAVQALSRLLPWASGEAARLDELAPERILVPSGSRIRIDYDDPERPVLAVKLQEMFGLQRSPGSPGCRSSCICSPPPAARRGHRRPGLLLEGRLQGRTRGAARPVPEASVARGPGHGGADAVHQGAARQVTGSGGERPAGRDGAYASGCVDGSVDGSGVGSGALATFRVMSIVVRRRRGETDDVGALGVVGVQLRQLQQALGVGLPVGQRPRLSRRTR
ncbi:hypothetical protein SVIOM342S_04346 [Streptomyces violaceorubidus]